MSICVDEAIEVVRISLLGRGMPLPKAWFAREEGEYWRVETTVHVVFKVNKSTGRLEGVPEGRVSQDRNFQTVVGL